ncbi:insulinase family protein [bacterium]|nr:MAG: insulinase family protein [bacterium]
MLRPVAKTLSAAIILCAAAIASAQSIQFEKYVLPNGMTVILHEDHSLPVAAVNLWYKVGSKDEPPRRSGFAHLFEHLMFMGTKRVPNGRFDTIMEAAGGSNNASTAEDRTDYYESGPSNLLPTLLWLEADRLETLGRGIDQKKLDLQRDVVKNERRQNTENTPYGQAGEAINALMFPSNHPYGHSVIGSMADLNNATVADVQDFFATYYVPNNAILAVVGDFKSEDVKAQIAKLFGTLPRKNDPPRPLLPAFEFKTKRVTMVDRVPQAKLTMVWHSPARFKPGDAELDLLASTLSSGVSSRLYKRLVVNDKLATDVSAYQESRYLSSLFNLEVVAAEGADLAKIEAAVDDELRKLKVSGPTADELERARAQAEVAVASSTQSVTRLASDLTEFEFYIGTPDGYTRYLSDLRAVSPARAREQARKTFDPDARLILSVIPEAEAAQEPNPRDVQPNIGTSSAFTAPVPVDFTLKNGLKVHYFERKGVPLVSMALLSRHGAAEDPTGKTGTTSLMAELLSAGAGSRGSEAFESELDRLGASFGAGASTRTTTASLTVLERNLSKALPLFLDALSKPRFEADEIDRAKRVRLADLAQEANEPGALANKVASEAFFGAGSPLGRPVSGTPTTVPAIERTDIEAAYKRTLGPAASELFVAGGLSVDALKAELEKGLGSWTGTATPAASTPFTVTPKPLRVLIVDRPDAVQTNVRFLFPAPPLGDANRAAVQSAATALGGSFTSRLVQNIREDKGYAYGASARYSALPGVGYMSVASDVRADATGPALKEFLKEFERLRGGDLTPEEVTKSAQLRRAAAIESLGTLGGLLSQATGYATNDQTLAQLGEDLNALSALNAGGVNAATKLALQSDQGVLVLVGDRATIEKALAEAGLPTGEVVKSEVLRSLGLWVSPKDLAT